MNEKILELAKSDVAIMKALQSHFTSTLSYEEALESLVIFYSEEYKKLQAELIDVLNKQKASPAMLEAFQKENEAFKKKNDDLRMGMTSLLDAFHSSITGQPIRNADELIMRSEKLVGRRWSSDDKF